MSLGFGFGLPHYVAVLGGGGPSGPVYFLSITSQLGSGGFLIPYSISVDSSENITVFGVKQNDSYDTGFGFTVNSSGNTINAKKKINGDLVNRTGSTVGLKGISNGSGNFYAVANTNEFYCCFCSTFPMVYTLNSSLDITSLKSVNTLGLCNAHADRLTKDSSGNLYIMYDSNGYSYLAKINPSLSTINTYAQFCCGSNYIYINGVEATSNNSVIAAGQASLCCSYLAYIQSVASSNLATLNWCLYSGDANGFRVLALDSSNKSYVSNGGGASQGIATIVVIPPSGIASQIPWQKAFDGITSINSIATETVGSNTFTYAVGYIIGIGPNVGHNSLAIVKLSSSGNIQYARYLTPTNGSINISTYNNIATIANNTLYITAQYSASGTTSTLILKVPTDGSHTGTISLAGDTFSYTSANINALPSTYTFDTIGLGNTSSPQGPVARTQTMTTLALATPAVAVL